MKFDLVLRKLLTIFPTCDARLLVRKVCEPNQVDHVIGHLDIGSLTVKTFGRIWIKIGKLVVETLYFSWHICHSGTKSKK